MTQRKYDGTVRKTTMGKFAKEAAIFRILSNVASLNGMIDLQRKRIQECESKIVDLQVRLDKAKTKKAYIESLPIRGES